MIARLLNWWFRVSGAQKRWVETRREQDILDQNHFWGGEMDRILARMRAANEVKDMVAFNRAARAFNVVQRRWNAEVARKVCLEELEMLPIRRIQG